jgi:hypothetical protein
MTAQQKTARLVAAYSRMNAQGRAALDSLTASLAEADRKVRVAKKQPRRKAK